jgi:hypothetical protein
MTKKYHIVNKKLDHNYNNNYIHNIYNNSIMTTELKI